jgi:hypothetical protein
MIKISVITPIRENLEELYRLMKSLEETTENLEEIEIILVADKCDKVVVPLIPELEERYKRLGLRFYIVERSEHFVRDYYNFAAKQAKGRWVLGINVDVVFMTPSWDRIIINKMGEAAERYKDDILYGIVKDGLPRAGDEGIESCKKAIWPQKIVFSCWILTSKAFVDFYGGMMDEINWTWGADHWTGIMWQNVFEGSRVVMIREVFIDHISHHVKDIAQSKSFQYFSGIMRRHPMRCTQAIAEKEARRIEEHIRSIHDGKERSS